MMSDEGMSRAMTRQSRENHPGSKVVAMGKSGQDDFICGQNKLKERSAAESAERACSFRAQMLRCAMCQDVETTFDLCKTLRSVARLRERELKSSVLQL